MALRAVIFDMDGVLIDSWQAHKDSWQHSAEARGLTCSDDDFSRLYGHGFYVWVKELGGSHLSAEEIQWWYDNKERLYREMFRQNPVIMDGVETLHQALAAANITLAVGSAGPRPNVDMAISMLATSSLIQQSVSADDVEHPKPAPDIFLEAARRMGVQPEECAVIEDSLHGIEAAHAAGMKVVGLAGTESLAVLEQHADRAVDSHHQITVAMLQGLCPQ